ncbi:hypothetical protein ACFYWD_22230 [Streptomyces sp. NPDC003781]|uniref:hypothetical protein n=1 Tax=Streptomyces sp. NPDC003781 TaxID=3364686 RepID=UPI0036C1B7B6
MSPAARAARLRVLVLLLALIVPCSHMTVEAAPVPVAAGAVGEYDHLDSALRVAARSGRRATVVRPVPPSFVADLVSLRSDARPERAAGLPRGPRSVVLRC